MAVGLREILRRPTAHPLGCSRGHEQRCTPVSKDVHATKSMSACGVLRNTALCYVSTDLPWRPASLCGVQGPDLTIVGAPDIVEQRIFIRATHVPTSPASEPDASLKRCDSMVPTFTPWCLGNGKQTGVSLSVGPVDREVSSIAPLRGILT